MDSKSEGGEHTTVGVQRTRFFEQAYLAPKGGPQ